MKFHKKVKFLRDMTGETQAQLAGKLNVTQACLAQVEAGKRGASLKLVKALKKHFNCSYDWLLEEPPNA